MIVCALFEPFALWHACLREPSYWDEPLVVLEQGRVTGVSDVAAEAGVKTGMAVEGARSRCKGLVVVEPNPATLHQAWEALLAQLYAFTDGLEPVGLGRVFLELAEEDAQHVARIFQARVADGSSQEHAHLLALTLKEGEARLEPFTTERQALDALPLSVLRSLGLNPKTLERFTWLGVTRLGDLRRWSKAQLGLYLGDKAKTLVRYLHGPYRSEVARYIPPVALSESYNFEDAALEPSDTEPVLKHLASTLAAALGDRAATRLAVTAEAQSLAFSSSRVSKQPLRSEASLFRLASLAFSDSGAQGLGVDRLELTLTGLYRPSVHGSLWQRKEEVEKAVRAVEARFPGAMLKFKELDPHMPASEFSHRLVSLGAKEVTHDAPSRGRGAGRVAEARERPARLTPR